MYIAFDQLSDQAHLWIYQADCQLSQEQEKAILQKAQNFLEAWTSHGRPLQGSALMRYNRFLLLAIEKPAYDLSCCTIDSAVHFLHALKDSLHINFLDRTQVCFQQDDHMFTVPINQVNEKMQQGTITGDTLMFDNTITHKAALADQWLIPVKESWLNKQT